MSTKKTNEEKAGEIGAVVNRAKAAGAVSQKERDTRNAKNAAVLASVAQTTVEKAVTAVTTAGLSVQKSLAEVSAELQAKLVELAQVDDAIAIRMAELGELHDKETVAAALDQLLVKYETQKADLNKQISEQRVLWDQEQRFHVQAVTERDAENEKYRKRTEDAYQYLTAQQHKSVEDVWNEQQRLKYIAEEERAQALTKSWDVKTQELAARESVLLVKEAEVAKGLTEQQAKDLKRDHAIELNSTKRTAEHQTALDKQTAQSRIDLLTAQVNAVEFNAKRVEAVNADLQAKIAEANKQITEIATKALDAASGRQALLEVQSSMQRGEQNGPSKGRA
jgi:hypothetical protein